MSDQLHSVIEVPANGSRYFESQEEALSQPRARLQLILDETFQFLRNQFFNSELIKHDSRYCTSNAFHLAESVAFVKSMPDIFSPDTQLIEIGCGQGEFIEVLESFGVQAVGFDPVCKTRGKNLFSRYFDPTKDIKNQLLQNIYYMRCVLPHIENPFQFLDQIFLYDPNAKVLMEFQNLEWILENSAWHQFSHDHANYFSMDSFDQAFNLISKGTFALKEWGWVLISQKKSNSTTKAIIDYSGRIPEIMRIRNLHLKQLFDLKKPIGIYGAAGKGIVFGDALKEAGINEIFGIDENVNYRGKFMEGSGIEILSPQALFPKESSIMVMNPRHFNYSLQSLGSSVEIVNLFGAKDI